MDQSLVRTLGIIEKPCSETAKISNKIDSGFTDTLRHVAAIDTQNPEKPDINRFSIHQTDIHRIYFRRVKE